MHATDIIVSGIIHLRYMVYFLSNLMSFFLIRYLTFSFLSPPAKPAGIEKFYMLSEYSRK